MKALMKDLGPDFKFPEWKCAAKALRGSFGARYRMNKLDSCSSEVAISPLNLLVLRMVDPNSRAPALVPALVLALVGRQRRGQRPWPARCRNSPCCTSWWASIDWTKWPNSWTKAFKRESL